MSPAQKALQQFRRGELSFDQLLVHFDELVRVGVQASDILGDLEVVFSENEIPPPIYNALKSRLMASHAWTTQVVGDEATRLAASDTETVPVSHVRDEEITSMPSAHVNFHVAERDSRSTLKVGDTLKDRFVLQEVLGRGGMGVVFKALDLRRKEANDRDPYVALKVLNQDFQENPMSFIALQRECKRAQTLSHPNIIHVYDFDRDGPHVFMSMEYLRGIPLNRLIKDLPEGGLPFRQAWPLILGMSEALANAHKKDIVHSDFKPGNVFIDEQQEVRVLDFGIACAIGRHDKGDATIFNARDLGALTPAYASLEMLHGEEPDARDDIYALACVSYELLSGKHPFGRLAADKVFELGLQPKPISGLSRRRWKALQKALALKRDDRTATVTEFIRALQIRSPTYYGAWIAGLSVLLAVAINVYLDWRQPLESPKPAIMLSPEQNLKIRDLLELAEIHFEVGYLTAPTGSNALWAYREALKMDPYNEAAAKGIKKIADTLEQKAWEFYEQGNRADSLKAVNEGLQADPKHQGLLELRRKLES